jgi:transcriptional regulator with XRE-family HTH domain
MVGIALRVEPFGVDASEPGSKNGGMTPEQLQQFAETLRTGRAKLDLNKVDFCKKAGITTNTLRALERGAQDPSQRTIDRIARMLGTTPSSLTSGKRAIDTSDPLLADLNDEDLEVAQAFHHAPMRVKQRALGVLQERARRGRGKDSSSHDVAEWSRRLLGLDPEKRQAIATVIAEFEAMLSEDESAAPKDAAGQPARVVRGKVGA